MTDGATVNDLATASTTPAFVLSLKAIEDYLIECEVPLSDRDQLLAGLRQGGSMTDEAYHFAPVGRGMFTCYQLEGNS